jgi:hypothetical protein
MAPNLNDTSIDVAVVEKNIETSYKAGEETTHTDEEQQAVDSDGDMKKFDKDHSPEQKRTKPFIILAACCAALGKLATSPCNPFAFAITFPLLPRMFSFFLLRRWPHFWL